MALIIARVGEPIAWLRVRAEDFFVRYLAGSGLCEETEQKSGTCRVGERSTDKTRRPPKSPPRLRRGCRGHKPRQGWLVSGFNMAVERLTSSSNHPGSSPRLLPSPP